MSAAEDYAASRGWQVRRRERWVSGPQLVLDCPLCGAVCDTEHRRFYLAVETGLWRTYCCNEQGNLLQLRRRLGDLELGIRSAVGGLDPMAGRLGAAALASRSTHRVILRAVEGSSTAFRAPDPGSDLRYHAALLADERALEYLRAVRGFSNTTIAEAKLGLRKSKDGCEWIAIPHHASDGVLVGAKYRLLPWHDARGSSRFAREPGGQTVLYGANRLCALPAPPAAVTIYEGELDRLSGDQIGLPLGLASTAGSGTWLPEWTALLAGIETIYLAQDTDRAGDDGAEKVADALGRWRCRRVRLPLHDVNDCLAAGLLDETHAAIITAEAMQHPLIRRPETWRADLLGLNLATVRGAATGMATFDALLGGRRGGEISVITGETGQGKTTWTTYMAWLAATRGEPALLGSFELAPQDEALKLATMEAGQEYVSLSEHDRALMLDRLARKPLYLIDTYGRIGSETLYDTLRYFYRACGGKLAVIDHLGFLGEPGDRWYESQERFLLGLARLLKTELTGLHVYVVAHPKNTSDERGRPRRVDKYAIKGGSAVRQIADNIIVVERALRLDGKHRAYLRIEKVRSILGEEGSLVWDFDRRSLRYHEPSMTPATRGTQQPLPGVPTSKVPATVQGLDGKSLAAGEKEEP